MGKAVGFFSGAVPAKREDFAKALSQTSQTAKQATASAGDVPLLRMSRTGNWQIGQDNDQPEDGSNWAINPGSIAVGYIAWKDGAPLDERMATVGQEPINKADLPDDMGTNVKGPDKGKVVAWTEQTSFDLQCVDGDDAGLTVRFKATSFGGRKEASRIIDEIAKRMASPNGYTDIVPMVTLEADSYEHKQYGEIFTPDFVIQGWLDPAEQEDLEDEEDDEGEDLEDEDLDDDEDYEDDEEDDDEEAREAEAAAEAAAKKAAAAKRKKAAKKSVKRKAAAKKAAPSPDEGEADDESGAETVEAEEVDDAPAPRRRRRRKAA